MKKELIQKIFCYISFLFLLSCCIFYGTRFIKFYVENEKKIKIEKNTLVKVVRENNYENENFKSIDDSKYFINKSDNNYLLYSNILWRIIKINEDNSITVISDSALTSLAFGENKEYTTSYINKWLNSSEEEYSGILEKHLNNIETYLQPTNTCLDKINTLDNNECQDILSDNYISLLSTNDFVNIGNKESYVINNEYFYLNNTNDKLEVWYVDNEGKVTTSKGKDIIGVKPVITIRANVEYVNGNGTKENPYQIEKENGYFGSYVKLDNSIWRIYQVNETEVRLVLNDYLKVKDTELNYIFSNNTSYHDKSKKDSIAYYLNNTFLNTLSYKSKIKEVKWSNGYYGSNSNYDYKDALNKTVSSKVGLISISDIILNNNLEDYYTLTGTKEKGALVYSIKSNKKYVTKNIGTKAKVVPAISLDISLLNKGNGTYQMPFELE